MSSRSACTAGTAHDASKQLHQGGCVSRQGRSMRRSRAAPRTRQLHARPQRGGTRWGSRPGGLDARAQATAGGSRQQQAPAGGRMQRQGGRLQDAAAGRQAAEGGRRQDAAAGRQVAAGGRRQQAAGGRRQAAGSSRTCASAATSSSSSLAWARLVMFMSGMPYRSRCSRRNELPSLTCPVPGRARGPGQCCCPT